MNDNVLDIMFLNGNTIKSGDRTPISIRLIGADVDNQVGEVYLHTGYSIVYRTKVNVEDNKLDFFIDKRIEPGSYYLEISVGDHKFPSDDNSVIRIGRSCETLVLSDKFEIKPKTIIIDAMF